MSNNIASGSFGLAQTVNGSSFESVREKRKVASSSSSTEEPTAKKRKVGTELNGSRSNVGTVVTKIQEVIRQTTGLLPDLVNLVSDYIPGGEEAYQEVTKMGTKPQADYRIYFDAIFDKRVNDTITALESGPWKNENPLFKSPDFHLIALKALRMGGITNQQFATCSIFAAAYKDAQKTPSFLLNRIPSHVAVPLTVPLFDAEGQPTKDAVAIISQSVKTGGDINGETDTNAYTFLDKEKIELFFDLMRKLPASNSNFY